EQFYQRKSVLCAVWAHVSWTRPVARAHAVNCVERLCVAQKQMETGGTPVLRIWRRSFGSAAPLAMRCRSRQDALGPLKRIPICSLPKIGALLGKVHSQPKRFNF